jgi:hypothetical protein
MTPPAASEPGETLPSAKDGGSEPAEQHELPEQPGPAAQPEPAEQPAQATVRRPPPSVRDAAGPPRPVREGGAGPRPTPAREALGAEAAPPPVDIRVPARDFDDDGGRPWRVHLVGRARSGTPPDPGAPLALLLFEPDPATPEPSAAGEDPRPSPEPPPADGSAEEVLEVLAVAGELDDLSEADLRRLLKRARPAGFEPSPLFPGTGGGRGRRGGR